MSSVTYTEPGSHPALGRKVIYNGDSRKRDLEGLEGTVVMVMIFDTGSETWAVKFAEISELQYAADWAWGIVNKSLTSEQAEAILNPSVKTVDVIDAEIKRLNERIAELTKAREVISSL